MALCFRLGAKQAAKLTVQWVAVDVFDGHEQDALAIVAAAAFCRADFYPVRRSVSGASKAIAFDEGLKQVNGVPVLGLPQRVELARGQPEHMAGQMRDANPGQDKKAHIVGHQWQVLSTGRGIPADEFIARGDFPSRGAKEQASQRALCRIDNE